MLHHLRIALTAFSLTACVLLMALWVRSFYWEDRLLGSVVGIRPFSIVSREGRLRCFLPKEWRQLVFRPGEKPKLLESGKRDPARRNPMTLPGAVMGFGFTYQKGNLIALAPYWFFVLGSGALAVVPWLKVSRRFSLRTLLIASTLVAVALGILFAQ